MSLIQEHRRVFNDLNCFKRDCANSVKRLPQKLLGLPFTMVPVPSSLPSFTHVT